MPSLEQSLIYQALRDISRSIEDFELFIETGTLVGETSAMASTIFKQVYTIEVYEPLYCAALERFKNSNVTPMHGDSISTLPLLLDSTNKSTIFWLDGHNSGPGTGVGQIDFPLLAECTAIDNHFTGKEALILIDDVRLFGKGHSAEIDNSLKSLTVQQVLEVFKKRSISRYAHYDSELAPDDRLAIHIV